MNADLSTLDKLYASGAYLPLSIVIVFLLVTAASRRVAWLQVPNRAHYVSAVIAGLAILVGPATQGTTPNLSMMFAALGAMAALLLPGAPSTVAATPTTLPTATVVKMPSSPPAGFIRRDLLVFVAITMLGVGCAWWASEKKALPTDAIDCTKAELVPTLLQLAPLADQLLLGATDSAGKVDPGAGSAAFSALKGDLRCIAADAIARALKPAPADPSAPKASPLVADHASLLSLKAALYPGVQFHTATGDL